MKSAFLSRFSPSLMTPEALESIFVQREDLAATTLEQIRHGVEGASEQHTLFLGPRGIGKTHMVSLLHYRLLAMSELRDRMRIAWLREEEWGVTSFLDLLLRIIRALDPKYEDPSSIESLYALSPDRAESKSVEILKTLVGDRALLVIVENLDDLFKKLGRDDQLRFLRYLRDNPSCMILATAQGWFPSILPSAPFHDFFAVHQLEELTFQDAVRLLSKIASYSGNRELKSFISTPTGRERIHALRHIAGGNHRAYVIFSQFLTRESLEELVLPLVCTIDDLTPYYQARMAALAPQQQKIIEWICERGRPVSQEEIVRRCFMNENIASEQLQALWQSGLLRAIAVKDEKYYELREPLMRLSIEVKKHRGKPIRLLIDFLRLWYSPAELRQRLATLPPDASLERNYVLPALQMNQEQQGDPRVFQCSREYNEAIGDGDYARALQAAEELIVIRSEAQDWLAQASCLRNLGSLEKALASCDKAIELNSELGRAWASRSEILLQMARPEEAREACEKAIQRTPNEAGVWSTKGMALADLGLYEEALTSFDKVVELDAGQVGAYVYRGAALLELERGEEALLSAQKAIELASENPLGWVMHGTALCRVGRHAEALSSYNRAIALGENSPYVLFQQAELMLAKSWREGSAALDQALGRFAYGKNPYAGNIAAIVRKLIAFLDNSEKLRLRIKVLVLLYRKHGVLSALAFGLLESIRHLKGPDVLEGAARRWEHRWRRETERYPEFRLCLHLLDHAVRYWETRDLRVLLALSFEERGLLESMLDVSPAAIFIEPLTAAQGDIAS